MATKASILPFLELGCPVLCGGNRCDFNGKPFNTVFVPMDEEDAFYEAFGNGGEDTKDKCPCCSELGILENPYVFFFYSTSIKKDEYVIALRMSLSFIETLQRILKNAHEEKKSKKGVFLASDPGNEFFDDFHVFEMGNESVFAKGDFLFRKPDFNERSKVAIVTKDGICLSCDISSKDPIEKDIGTVKTCVFSNNALAELNSWVVERVGPAIDESEPE